MTAHRDIDDMTAIFETALQKYRKGEQKYGTYNPATDPRNMIIETEAEILDAINYLAMFLIKLRAKGKPMRIEASARQLPWDTSGNAEEQNKTFETTLPPPWP